MPDNKINNPPYVLKKTRFFQEDKKCVLAGSSKIGQENPKPTRRPILSGFIERFLVLCCRHTCPIRRLFPDGK
jgi:hypothetical protein